jgi:hypothetical protein
LEMNVSLERCVHDDIEFLEVRPKPKASGQFEERSDSNGRKK